jgi:hypothetical protein
MSTSRRVAFAGFALLSVAILPSVLFGQAADRRFPGKPGNPGASDLRQSYSQRGSMGGGYRPYSAWSYQQNARMHAQGLNTYAKTVDKCSPETVKEHVAEVKKSVAAAKKEVAKLGDEAAKKAQVKEHVDAMLKHFDEAEKMCTMMEESASDGKVVCDCCKTIDDELKAAEGEHKKMLETLGLPVPGPVSEALGEQEAKGAPAKKDSK